MSVQLVSLINAPQTIDGVVLPPYGYQVRSVLTAEITAAYTLRKVYYSIFDEEYDQGQEFTSEETAAMKLAYEAGLATYSASEVQRLSGILNLPGLAALLTQTTYPRPLIIPGTPVCVGPVTQPASSWGSLTCSDNGSGFLRIAGTGAHGLAAGNVGHQVYINAAAGLVVGLHKITSVNAVDANTLDFATLWAGAVTTPTYLAPNNIIPAFSPTIPGGLMGPNGCIDIWAQTEETTGNTNNRAFWTKFGGSNFVSATLSAATGEVTHDLHACIQNQGVENSQWARPMRYNIYTAGAALAIDTTVDQTLIVGVQIATAGEYVNIRSLRIAVTPGIAAAGGL